jgi:DNA-binding beta-propeller fold protein YncE
MRRLTLFILVAGVLVACFDDAPIAPPEDRSTTEPEPPVEPDFLNTLNRSLLAVKAPVRMAPTPSGQLLVADYHQGAILRVDPNTLQPDRGFRIDGKPSAVALMGDRIFVANVTSNTVDVFGSNGQWRYSFAPEAVERPTDLVVDPVHRLVLAVSGGTNVVKAFDVSGEVQFVIRDLWKPTGIAVDGSRQEILVSDYGEAAHGERASVRIFDYDGNPIATILGHAGMANSRFSRPQGLAVDGTGRIYLVDALSAEVVVLDRETGATVNTIGIFGPDPGQLLLPLDIVIGQTGDIYVTSYKTRRIERFIGVVAQ